MMAKQHLPSVKQPSIQDLALIGDQKSCALVDKAGTVVWYCLWRFDQASLFSLLIDGNGGYWSVEAAGKRFLRRAYTPDTAVLVTEFSVTGGSFSVTDFMPATPQIAGICRLFSPSPVPLTLRILPKPDYGRSAAKLKEDKHAYLVREDRFAFYIKASHPLEVRNGTVEMILPEGESGWCVLADDQRALPQISLSGLQEALRHTEERWRQIMRNLSYQGPYQKEMKESYRAIQLVRHAYSGGILAAATTSLPETIGGTRNYDYRYVWLRDTAMNVSAILRAGSKGDEAERFLDFLCTGRNTNKSNLFVPFYDLDAKTAPFETFLPASGYRHSTPVRIGNNATEQLQLDAQGNVLLAAKEIYERKKEKPHWKTISRAAEFVVDNWHRKDHGIWEEEAEEHFTSSKVLVTKSLEFLARYADTEKQRKKWLETAKQIRTFVTEHCLTRDGAYAVHAGSEAVDVTAALYAVWLYDQPDSAAMQQTIRRIELEYREGELYHRHLLESDSRKEGVFLAGSLWMAQYYLLLKDAGKAGKIIDAVLQFSTDLGFLPEEGDTKTGEPLGNIPQTFVHSSLMGVITDLKKVLENQ